MNQRWSLSFRYFAGAITLLGLLAFFYYIRDALTPLAIAAFIAYLISPAVTLLTSYTKLSRRSAVNLVYAITLTVLILLPAVLIPIFFAQIKEVTQDLLAGLDQTLSKPFVFAGAKFDLAQLGEGLAHLKENAGAPEKALPFIESTSRGAVWFLVIVVCVYLFLAEWRTIRAWLISFAPVAYQDEVNELYQRVRAVWMGYLRGQIILMVIVGVVFTIAWAIIGIPDALLLGVIAGLFTIVPDVGPFLAVAAAMAVALLKGSSWIPLDNGWVMIIVLVTYLVLINLKNLWLRPIIMGRSVHMNEGLVLVVILIATMLNGIMGALLIVPVLASGMIVLDYAFRRIAGQSPFPPLESASQESAQDKSNPNPQGLGLARIQAHLSSKETFRVSVDKRRPPNKFNRN